MKISEAFASYRKNEVLAMNYSPSTYENYQNAERRAIGFFGNIDVSGITLDGIHDFYLDMVQVCCADTARGYLSKLRVVLRYCRARGVKALDPEEIKLPRQQKKYARFLTKEEYSCFMKEISRSHHGYKNIDRIRNTIMAEMLFVTGIRVGELCALNRDSIKDRQFVVVGKSKEPRVCFITQKVECELNNYLAMRHDDNRALFVDSVTGNRVTKGSVQRIFRRVSKESGVVACTPHTMRHSFATYRIEEGVDIRFVAAMLGHQSLQTTQRYTHVRDSKLHQVYEAAMGGSF